MKTLDELKAFCEGYKRALVSERDFYNTPLTSTDDWVIWGGYDFNIAGSDYIPYITPKQLKVSAYPVNWKGELPDPLHTFII